MPKKAVGRLCGDCVEPAAHMSQIKITTTTRTKTKTAAARKPEERTVRKATRATTKAISIRQRDKKLN